VVCPFNGILHRREKYIKRNALTIHVTARMVAEWDQPDVRVLAVIYMKLRTRTLHRALTACCGGVVDSGAKEHSGAMEIFYITSWLMVMWVSK
jgi:hypothetical protein